MLADGQSLPPGFESLQASTQPNTGYSQIDGVYEDPSTGIVVRYTTARGPMSDVEPGEHIFHGVYPIDVCIRDTKGRSLIGPTSFEDSPYINDCVQRSPPEKQLVRGYEAALRGLEALKTVRFKTEYEPEHKSLVGSFARASPEYLQNLEKLLESGTVVKETPDGGKVISLDDLPSADRAR